MDSDVGRAFFEAIQTVWSDRLPFFLIAAGTPDAPRRIRRAGTFAERAFEQLPIGRLESAATASALATPATAAGRPIARAGARCLGLRIAGLPLLHSALWANAAWDAATSRQECGISGPAAGRRGCGRPDPRWSGSTWDGFPKHRSGRSKMSSRRWAALVSNRGGRVDDGDLRKLLLLVARKESVPYGRASLLTVLQDLGIVWETSSAVWELGIPSFADYVLRRTGKSPCGVA